MLGLEVASPFHLIIKLIVMLFEYLHRIGVGYPSEVRADNIVEPFKKPLVHELVEEVHFRGSIFKDIIDYILDHALGDSHVILKVGKGHLGFDHPELGRMPGGI